ncbi:MAG: hemolysin family protein [Candidatus Methanomethylophilaceae archaeon]|nr:hemolysin family protein [Candidatus Methanomethylophilaceae archaeon]MDY0224602.1 hemolysin family protein [Candidatus Methanomethylophilaceae archaeon]
MDSILLYTTIFVLVGLISLSAYFSASETAYSSLNPVKVKNLVNEGNKNAVKALDNYENFDKILTTILIGNNIVNVTSSTLCTMLFTEFFGATMGVIYATIFMVTVLLIFGEITPKTLAKRNSERYALKFASSLQVAMVIIAPIIWMFLKFTHIISKSVQDDSAETFTLTEDELYVMIDEIEEEGTIEKRESELIKSAIQFDDIKASEIFTPRADITAVDVRTDIEDMKSLFIDSEYSRIPVYDGTIDRIVGAIYSKDFYSRYINNEDFKLTDIIRPVKFVPGNTSIATLLTDLQKTKIHMAIVLDNFGGTVGIVCMEDILEELVGDIWDENDEVKYPVVKEKDASYTVLGEANIFDVMKELKLEFNPGEDLDTYSVSGFIHHKSERIPKEGDSIELDNVTIVVKSMKGRRIREAKFIPHSTMERINSQ